MLSLMSKDQYEEGLGQCSDRIKEIFQQQPWRKNAIVLLFGRESVEAIHFPSQASNGDILRTGQLEIFSGKGKKLGPGPGWELVFRLFSSSPEDLGFVRPFFPADFNIPNFGRIQHFQCLQRMQSSLLGPSSLPVASSSVYLATLQRPIPRAPENVVVKFGPGVPHEVRLIFFQLSGIVFVIFLFI